MKNEKNKLDNLKKQKEKMGQEMRKEGRRTSQEKFCEDFLYCHSARYDRNCTKLLWAHDHICLIESYNKYTHTIVTKHFSFLKGKYLLRLQSHIQVIFR